MNEWMEGEAGTGQLKLYKKASELKERLTGRKLRWTSNIA